MKESCRQYLSEQVGGDADMLNAIYADYAASVRAKAAEVAAAFDARQWETLDRAAHAIKGIALSAGDGEMAQLAITLREAVKAHGTDGGMQDASRLVSEMRQMSAAL